MTDTCASKVTDTQRPSLLVALIVSTGFLMESLDQNIVTASIPEMATEFGTTPERLALSITAYILAIALFIPLSGWIADRFGAKRVFICAIGVFTVASVFCGMATSLTELVLSRILQGAGGALMTPVGRLILLRSFDRKELVRALTWMTLPVLIGPLIGPPLGGFLTTYAHWRWIFFINIPIGLVGALLAWMFIPAMEPAPRTRFDLRGYLILALGLVSFQAAVELMVHGELPAYLVPTLLVTSIISLAVFAIHARRNQKPVLDIRLFSIRPFRIGVLSGGLSRIGLNAVPFLLQLKLQLQMGLSPFHAGMIVLFTAFGAICLKLMTVAILRWCGFRNLLSGNALIGSVLIAAFAFYGPDAPIWLLIIHVFVFGVVRSLQFNAVNSLTYGEIPRESQSGAVALGGVGQQISMGLGISLSAVLLAAGVGTGLDFSMAFVLMALIPLISIPGFLFGLRPDDGAETSGHRRAKQ